MKLKNELVAVVFTVLASLVLSSINYAFAQCPQGYTHCTSYPAWCCSSEQYCVDPALPYCEPVSGISSTTSSALPSTSTTSSSNSTSSSTLSSIVTTTVPSTSSSSSTPTTAPASSTTSPPTTSPPTTTISGGGCAAGEAFCPSDTIGQKGECCDGLLEKCRPIEDGGGCRPIGKDWCPAGEIGCLWTPEPFVVPPITVCCDGLLEVCRPLEDGGGCKRIGDCFLEYLYDVDSAEAELLRKYRDGILSKTSTGREIIRLYYEWSPVIVSAIEEDQELKEEVKELIDEMLSMIEETVE